MQPSIHKGADQSARVRILSCAIVVRKGVKRFSHDKTHLDGFSPRSDTYIRRQSRIYLALKYTE